MERKIIYKENSEEYKAIKLLEKKSRNYSLLFFAEKMLKVLKISSFHGRILS